MEKIWSFRQAWRSNWPTRIWAIVGGGSWVDRHEFTMIIVCLNEWLHSTVQSVAKKTVLALSFVMLPTASISVILLFLQIKEFGWQFFFLSPVTIVTVDKSVSMLRNFRNHLTFIDISLHSTLTFGRWLHSGSWYCLEFVIIELMNYKTIFILFSLLPISL